MHPKALRIRAPGMQTLVDMAEKHSTEESHRLLLAAESVAGGFSLAGWLESKGFDLMTAADGAGSVADRVLFLATRRRTARSNAAGNRRVLSLQAGPGQKPVGRDLRDGRRIWRG